jgi:heavy metal sensor kinase
VLRIETVRGRLTAYYVSMLAATLVIVGGLIYVLLARALYSRIDDNLIGLVDIATTSLTNDLDENQHVDDAARSTAAELSARQQMLAIYDGGGRLLAEEGRDVDLDVRLPPLETIPSDETMLITSAVGGGRRERHRLALRRVTIARHGIDYVIVAASPLEPTDRELESLRTVLGYVGPIALVVAGFGGWFLARQSLSPVVAMAERARKLGAEDLSGRLPVANPRDELGRLAEAFNDLLGRLEGSLTQQRHFMADASHELRTPVATARTAANVALQQPHRAESEYRRILGIIEQQATRLSRIVDDMFTMARADAGNYPVHRTPMYLDEVVKEVVQAARVLADPKQVAIDVDAARPAPFLGDEDLVRRLIVNLLDNAIRHAPSRSSVAVTLRPTARDYAIVVSDRGPGVPIEAQPHLFERFFRADPARTRARPSDDGAGLGLALARWIANVHGGEVHLTESSDAGTTFTAVLPHRDGSLVTSRTAALP